MAFCPLILEGKGKKCRLTSVNKMQVVAKIYKYGQSVVQNIKLCVCVSIEMSPAEEFLKSLKWLRLLFKIISRDIFAVNYKDGKGFYVYVGLWLSYISCQAVTVFDKDHYDISIRMICASLGCGSIQVMR